MSVRQERRAAWMDGIAIALSISCVIHGLLLPIALALVPVWSNWFGVPEDFHVLIVLLALPLSSIVLWRVARRSQVWGNFHLGVAGLTLMLLGTLVSSEAAEAAITSFGGLLVACAHVSNWRRRSKCSL